MQMYDNIIDAIGRTPLVRINKLNPNPEIPLYAKVEGFNPTGSIKDRIAIKMIEQAEECGVLTKGKTIIEPTFCRPGRKISEHKSVQYGRLTGLSVVGYALACFSDSVILSS